MDYPHQARINVLAHASVHDMSAEPELAAKLATPGYCGRAERGFVSYIEAATAPLRKRISELEAEVAALRRVD